tara:strand:+ start:5910 stop:6419 length:510 start_codon:yes stop_codon:yes gene_type:complete
MELNEKEKISIKDRLINFFNTNKVKVYVFLFILVIAIIIVPIIKYKINQQNISIAENYIQAGLYLSSGEKKKSIGEYEKIIYSGNKFYSVLALNKILEKDLVKDDKKIFKYFAEVEKNSNTSEQADLVKLKKALYFIKTGNSQKGKKLLENLINDNSQFKSLAKEIIAK